MYNQKKGLKRNTIDKFYTKPEIANYFIDIIKKNIKILKSDLIIEPSAGNGSFIEGIKKISNNYLFFDIDPEHDEIYKQDFLELESNLLKPGKDYKNIHIIGNPPFGRQSSYAIQFIKKCCSNNVSSISFILPKSFKKDSLKKYFSLNYHLIFEEDIDNNSFLVNDKECDVPCVFQIWVYKNYKREFIQKQIPIKFKFVKKTENPDISFRRVGINAGTISLNINDKSIQSHYFIKFILNDDIIDDIIEKLKSIKFNFNNTVGPKSISKQELIIEFNKIL